MLGAGLYGVLRAEATLARQAIGNADDAPPRLHRLVRPRPTRPGHQDRAPRRLQRRRLRRRPGRGDPRRPPRERHRRGGRPPGAPARLRQGRRPVLRPRRPDRPGADHRPRPRGDPDRRQRRHPPGAAVAVGAPPRRRRTTAPRGRRQGLVGTCPDLGTVKPIPPPLKQVARSWSRRLAAAQAIAVVEAGRRRGVAGLDPGARLRGRAGAALRARPVPPVGRGLPTRWPRY